MATKQIDPQIILKLVAEDRPFRQMCQVVGCGDTLIYRAVSDLSAQGLIERKRGAATKGASGYRLTPLGYQQVGSFTKPAPKPPVNYAKPTRNPDGSALTDTDREPPMTAEQIAALRLRIPTGFTIRQLRPNPNAQTPITHPYYVDFAGQTLMRLASLAEAMVAANRLAEAIRWHTLPILLEAMRDLMLDSDGQSPFYHQVVSQMRRGLSIKERGVN